MDARIARLGSILIVATCAALAQVEALVAQGEPSGAPTAPIGDSRQPVAKLTLKGFVLAPDGSPAEGAVVVSSAGGKAITDAAGAYQLDVEVPLEASSLEVTAVGCAGGSLVASASVALSAAIHRTSVDPLQLARGGSCSPAWLPTFGGEPGTNGTIAALTVYDDGGGPALYAGGNFTTAGGASANRIAKWNGSSWSALGSGMSGAGFSTVQALAVYDDGGGPALYAGGSFDSAGGVTANRIAKWDGTDWSPLGSGLNGPVHVLAVHDDGGGPALYAGGGFTTAGGVAANRIAKWDGTSWTPLGSGLNDGVLALAVYEGGGPALYVGGVFTNAGGVAANRIAKWDGSNWAPVGSGVDDVDGDFDEIEVDALAVFDGGTGPALYAGGSFSTAGGVATGSIARWDGSSWSALGGGFGGSYVRDLAVYDEGGGPALYVGGQWDHPGSRNIARWDGSSWSGLPIDMDYEDDFVLSMAAYDDGSGPALFVGGDFPATDQATKFIGRWDGKSWAPLSSGMDGQVRALAVYDDGDGPALYAGGLFTTSGGLPASRIARWDGSSWAAVGGGLNGGGLNGDVEVLVVHDDGSGPALYAGGRFTAAGGVPAKHVARWDGSSWSALGSGLNGGVDALAVYDDGGGPALYAGGEFTSAGGVLARRIAKWDGSSWAPLASGMDGQVHALAVHDFGGGPALYAGGAFSRAGRVPASHVAKWDGASWSPLGSGVNGDVLALAVYQTSYAGDPPTLFAGGSFTAAGSVAAMRIARWNGSSWARAGIGMDGDVEVLAVHQSSYGLALMAGGSFTTADGRAANRIATWNGWSWYGTAEMNGGVAALAEYDDGGGPALYVGGEFTSADGVPANHIAKLAGSGWSPLRSKGMNSRVAALAVYDDGGGPALYAGGDFTSVAGVTANRIAKWDGSRWSALGSGLSSSIHALAVYDDGGGPALYAAGSFLHAGGVRVNGIARWDGSSWSALRSGVSGYVHALAVYDGGGGPALYAAGVFARAGGMPVNHIARWDGSNWSSVGGGFGGGWGEGVSALAVYDDGAGPALYAGGTFSTAGGVPAKDIARWNGSGWAPLGSGMGGTYAYVMSFAVHDDGGGPALYAGGQFASAGGVAANHVAKWDGASWSPLGGGVGEGNSYLFALAVFDDGSGPALYAGGSFTSVGGVVAKHIARWNGTSWSELGSGVDGRVFALAVYDDGGGPALFAGGEFSSALDSGDSYLAKWGYPPDLEPPTLACPSSVLVLDGLGSAPGEIVTFSVPTSDCRDPSPSVVCVPPSGSFFPRGTTLVTCTATDASGNQSTCEFPVTVAPKARQR